MEELIRRPKKDSNPETIAAAFDAVAETYDSEFDSSPVTRRLRWKIYQIIQNLVPTGGAILDVNCGTGTDAHYLASIGYYVTGIDVSPKMIGHAIQKTTRMESVRFHVGSFEELSGFLTAKYDLALSNFGGLNCTDQLNQVAEQLSAHLFPHGYVVAVVLSPLSVWEIASNGARLRWKRATRRLRGVAQASGFQGKPFTVHYHSPSKLSKAFRPWFEVKQLVGLNTFSPPPHALSWAKNYPRLTSLLEKVDSLLEAVPPFNALGDHYVMVLKRKEHEGTS
jgi:SAM-dependent methyltransferase